MTTALFILFGLCIAAWIYLIVLRGGYWQLQERLPGEMKTPETWPTVAVVIPARNEADLIGETVRRLTEQTYPGDLRLIVVNDHSEDGTGDKARQAGNDRTVVIDAEARPEGWMGKVWAMEQGVRHLREMGAEPDYILFTDADIHHPPDSVSRLVAHAEEDRRDLVSLMVRLKVETFWERLLIPVFVLFFSKLYPFGWVNDPTKSTAAAAGGCMLVRNEVVQRANLMEAIRGELIDDCALARAVRDAGSGRIWLGLTEDVHSARAYGGLSGVWDMVARTAFTQLRFSPILLLGSVAGMISLYLSWMLALPFDIGLAIGCFALPILTFSPALRLYGQPAWMMALLPLAGLMYALMTLDSARRHWTGRGGNWKGRYQAKIAK
ncbi:glycosyltransferase [Minwuia sp.]|uniref:glycosyltransferase n=1 Tax=Minwuia sp. TaxID=2493630 RepID=UPI003A940196